MKGPRRADKQIPPALRPIDRKMHSVDEYEMVDVNNDYMAADLPENAETPVRVATSSRSFHPHILIWLGMGRHRGGHQSSRYLADPS